MKIGILGSGTVGQQLGLGFLQLGHTVMIGTRDPGKLAEWKKSAGANASVGTFEETARTGDLVVLATLWTATAEVLRLAGMKNFENKIVIDVTNPLDFSKGTPPRFVSAPDNSGGEQIQNWLPKSKIVKAFNTISALIMCNAKREEGAPDLFIAGNDAGAKKTVAEFAAKWGWNSVVDLGDIHAAFLLEAFAMLWITYGFKNNNWTHAFKLLKK